jgi:hypothetical protein
MQLIDKLYVLLLFFQEEVSEQPIWVQRRVAAALEAVKAARVMIFQDLGTEVPDEGTEAGPLLCYPFPNDPQRSVPSIRGVDEEGGGPEGPGPEGEEEEDPDGNETRESEEEREEQEGDQGARGPLLCDDPQPVPSFRGVDEEGGVPEGPGPEGEEEEDPDGNETRESEEEREEQEGDQGAVESSDDEMVCLSQNNHMIFVNPIHSFLLFQFVLILLLQFVVVFIYSRF